MKERVARKWVLMDRPPWKFAQAFLPDIVEQATNSATWNLVFSWPHLHTETVVPHRHGSRSQASQMRKRKKKKLRRRMRLPDFRWILWVASAVYVQ